VLNKYLYTDVNYCSDKNKIAQSNLATGRVATNASADPTYHPIPTVQALSHSYAGNSPLVTIGRPTFAPKITPSRGPIPKLNYLPHPWTHPIYRPKQHPHPIRRFATMHWTVRQIDRWLEEMFDDYRPLSLYSERRGLINVRNLCLSVTQ